MVGPPAMTKVIGIATKPQAAVVFMFYSVDVDRECVINIVKNNFQEKKSKESQTGIAQILYVQKDFIKHKRIAVLLHLVYLFWYL